MPYQPLWEESVIELSAIYTFYHFHFATGYVFRGERHPFWEMVYVDSGQVDIGADEETLMLGGGDVIFHRPNEFHSIWANYAHAPNLIVVSFASDSPAMRYFEKKKFRITGRQQAMLQGLLREAGKAFVMPHEGNDPIPNPHHPGGVYTLRLILTQLLMDMLSGAPIQRSAGDRRREPDAAAAEMIDSLVGYMRAHLGGELRFEDLCRRVGMSATAVKQLFRQHFEVSPMAYYEQVRMGEARRMFREGDGNIATVAYALGFSSPAYFSTRFKHVNGMSPREYLKEIQGI